MSSDFGVYINYLYRRNKVSDGIVLDFKTDFLRSFQLLNDAMQYVHNKRIKRDETLYIIRQKQKTIYYRSINKKGYVS